MPGTRGPELRVSRLSSRQKKEETPGQMLDTDIQPRYFLRKPMASSFLTRSRSFTHFIFDSSLTHDPPSNPVLLG
jgi:hypothetical protein